ncbi:hypothetical protein BAUCODRAFT_90408, partial [Baudoinia panamericana UAMH 10762]
MAPNVTPLLKRKRRSCAASCSGVLSQQARNNDHSATDVARVSGITRSHSPSVVIRRVRSSSESIPPGATSSAIHITTKGAKRQKLSHVVVPRPAYPHSAFGLSNATAPLRSEFEAIYALKQEYSHLHADKPNRPAYTYFTLNDFSVYRPYYRLSSNRYDGELVTLDRLQNRKGCNTFLVDGVLACGKLKVCVKAVPISILTVDGYGNTDTFSLSGKICVQSATAAECDVWYQFGTPSPEYRRFFSPFLWLAHFTKSFVEYLTETENVTLAHFAADMQFVQWLQYTYGGDSDWLQWQQMANLSDYRTTVAANVGFLFKECWSVHNPAPGSPFNIRNQPVWGEVDPMNLKAIPQQPNKETATIVTPYAYRCFRHMYFGQQLKQMSIRDNAVNAQVTERKRALGLTVATGVTPYETGMRTPESMPSTPPSASPLEVNAGDVVSVEADKNGPWRSCDTVWYAYIMDVRLNRRKEQVLDVLWLYEPQHTTLGAAYYPFANELFLSDNCSCGHNAIAIDAVISKVDVKWHIKDPVGVAVFFARRKFCTIHEEDSYSFETLKDSDFVCNCSERQRIWDDCIRQFAVSDCVLVLVDEEEFNAYGRAKKSWLEPARVVAFNNLQQRVVLQLFQRKNRLDLAARANELLVSPEMIDVPSSRLIRKCNVREFEPSDIRNGRLPVPYDQNGAADCYYIAKSSSGHEKDGVPERISKPGSARELFTQQDSKQCNPTHKLRGMGIFCGGGNLDRGLEDGGAVVFDYAIDWAEHALHSYRANSRNPNARYFLGSVNDYLAAALDGAGDASIAAVGAVEVLGAGSPCPGFSNLQLNKFSDESLRNASMVAAVIAYVDFYSPKYFLLENVVNMTRGLGPDKTENVFSQVLAALVGLGYQVQQFLMDAWSYGSPQQRTRVFIVATAPGLDILPVPVHTHDHPSNMGFRERALGRSSNGLPFGQRRNDWTPFPHVSISDACSDLPEITDSQPQLCPSFPDHRTSSEEGADSRSRIALIPLRPYGMGLVKAVQQGLITGGEPLDYYNRLGKHQAKKNSTTYARVRRDGLMPTLTTVLRIGDGIAGRTIHWREHRNVTVQECKRAQGYWDEEVLVGSPAQQMKIIGNSVDRKVSLALGVALKEA